MQRRRKFVKIMKLLLGVYFLWRRRGYPNKMNNLLLFLYIVLKEVSLLVTMRSGPTIAISEKTDYTFHLPNTATGLIGWPVTTSLCGGHNGTLIGSEMSASNNSPHSSRTPDPRVR